MRQVSLAVAFAVVVWAAGCTPLRASSRERLSTEQSQVVLAEGQEEAARRVGEAFARRGFPLLDRRLDDRSTVYVFQGERQKVRAGSGGAYGVAVETYGVGSRFYARLTPRPEGSTRVELFGKPTLEQREVCSGDEPEWLDPCTGGPTTGFIPGQVLDRMTGREETELLRGVLSELRPPPSGGSEP
jgi:hypothetical protein